VTPDRRYQLVGADGRPYESELPGAFGGNRSTKIYGRLACPTAKRHIEKGGYVQNRVFFADEQTAQAAGYRPCAHCLPHEYAAWKNAH
jgi:methylphosphotriester-DNA--protein-cysteine methyltransferase